MSHGTRKSASRMRLNGKSHHEVEEVLLASERLITRSFLYEQEFMQVSSILGSGGGSSTSEKTMYKFHEELSNALRLSKIRHI